MSIYEDSSQNSTLPLTSTGVKGSDWVKSLQLKTPSKSESQADKPEIEDSAKKRKKRTKYINQFLISKSFISFIYFEYIVFSVCI